MIAKYCGRTVYTKSGINGEILIKSKFTSGYSIYDAYFIDSNGEKRENHSFNSRLRLLIAKEGVEKFPFDLSGFEDVCSFTLRSGCGTKPDRLKGKEIELCETEGLLVAVSYPKG